MYGSRGCVKEEEEVEVYEFDGIEANVGEGPIEGN